MSSAPSKEKERPHLSYVDGLRALCALWVVGGHEGAEVDAVSRIQGIFATFLLYSHFAVTIFIVISGFCLAIPVVRNRGALRGGVLTFFKKRARRILPPYYLTLLLSLGLIWTVIGTPDHTIWDASLPVHAKTIAVHLLLVHDFFNASAINYPLWSIAVEWQIYFLFPILVHAFARYGAGWTLLVAFLVTGAAEVYLTLRTALWGVPAHYVWLFALGMFAAEIGFGPGVRRVWLKISFWGSAVFGGWLLLLCYTDIYDRSNNAGISAT